MAFENPFKRDRDRDYGERNQRDWRQDWRADNDRRAFGTGEREAARGSDDDQDFERRGWREGSDYYGNPDERYGRSHYGLGDRSSGGDAREGGYGSQDYRRDYGGSDWRDEGTSYGGEFSGGSYTRGDFGEGSDDRTTRGSFGSGGMGGAETGSSVYGYGGTREHYRGRGPRGYRRSDEHIREDVCDLLTDDPYLDASNMDVQVKECEVTLTGSVSSREDKRRAEDLIERISGVKDVHNQLRVASEQRSASQQSAAAQGTQAGQTGQTPRH